MKVAITLAILCLAWIPLSIIAYGALGGLVAGLFILSPLVGLQVVLLRFLQRGKKVRD